jgi:hypothetical protein
MRSAPQSRLFAAISLIKAIVSDESLGFFERPLDLCLQNTRKSSRCQRKIVVFLNKEERLFPSPNHPGQEHQKKPVRLPVDRAFYLSPENDQLVSQQRVFRKEFGFSSGQIGECAKHKGGRRWFNPTPKMFLKRMKAETDTLFDGGEYTQHELNLSFVKMGALEDEYKQNGPCLLYSSLTNFGKEACSIMHNMSIIRTMS